jgi:TonB-dependent receptor
MQDWTHGALYNTSDFNVGVNNGWALPNYKMLDPATHIDFFENELARGLKYGIDVAGYNPRTLDEDTDGMFLEGSGKFDVLDGLRYDLGVRHIETDQMVSGYVTVNTPSGAVRQLQISNSSYDKNLPSTNIAFDVGHGVVTRAAYSKTMTRPAPGDIAPNEALSVNGDVLTRGNPDLSPYFSDNYDLGVEWYFGDSGLGVIAVNGWQKKIEGYTSIVSTPTPFGQLGIDYSTLPIATQTGLQSTANAQCTCTTGNPNDALVRVDQRQNTSELITLKGYEVTYVQPLDVLLKGAGFSLNYTHINQESNGGLPGAPSSAVTGLSPYTYNLTAFYENYGFSGRLVYSVRDAYVDFLGNNENNIQGDNFAQKREYLDASFSYKLPMQTNLSVSLEVQNILNEQLLTYFRDDPLTPRASFAPGRQLLLGVVGSF